MPDIRVHNITDRPNTEFFPRAINVARREIRPGKSIVVSSDLLSKKELALHDVVIWVGDILPPKYKATSESALRNTDREAPPMTREEAREYLLSLPEDELETLCSCVSPKISFSGTPEPRMRVIKLVRAIFSNADLDPDSFFWTRRWTRDGDTYLDR